MTERERERERENIFSLFGIHIVNHMDGIIITHNNTNNNNNNYQNKIPSKGTSCIGICAIFGIQNEKREEGEEDEGG